MARVPFPRQGLDTSLPGGDQPVGTSPSLQNVRAFDIDKEKMGGQRPGQVLAYTTRIVGDYPILRMVPIVTTYITPA